MAEDRGLSGTSGKYLVTRDELTQLYEDALLDFSKAIQLDANLADAYLNRARVYFESGDLEAAVQDMTSAIELTPDTPGLYLTRGRLYASIDDTERAAADLEQVLALTQDEALVVPARQLLIRLQ